MTFCRVEMLRKLYSSELAPTGFGHARLTCDRVNHTRSMTMCRPQSMGTAVGWFQQCVQIATTRDRCPLVRLIEDRSVHAHSRLWNSLWNRSGMRFSALEQRVDSGADGVPVERVISSRRSPRRILRVEFTSGHAQGAAESNPRRRCLHTSAN